MTAAEAGEPLVKVHVWDRVVRSTHWIIALAIVVLAVTGLYIGHPFLLSPGAAGGHFVMGTVKVVHFYAAIAFTIAVLARIAWLFLGSGHARWPEFLPVARERRVGLWHALQFYLFMRSRPDPAVGHNPAAGFTYIGVFGLYLVMIATGLGLYAGDAAVGSPFRSFEFLARLAGGAQNGYVDSSRRDVAAPRVRRAPRLQRNPDLRGREQRRDGLYRLRKQVGPGERGEARRRGEGPTVTVPVELLVLGLGNPLCGDDGAGIAAVARLLKGWSAPEHVLVLDGGTLGLALMAYLRQARKAILVDAVRTGDPPGRSFACEEKTWAAPRPASSRRTRWESPICSTGCGCSEVARRSSSS